MNVSATPAEPDARLRIAAIQFLNPAPLMWDFEHDPQKSQLAHRYQIDWMMPAQCAERLALPANHPDAADIGLVPVAALATTPGLKIIPGCAIASKHKVRSILLVRRASQPIVSILTVAADTSSRASLAYTQILFHLWGNPKAAFLQHPPDLDQMLLAADAAILIGDPALYALEDRIRREERTGEALVYHDLAEEWIKQTGVPWVSAVWAIRESSLAACGRTLDEIAADFTQSRDHGLANIDALVAEWSAKMPVPAGTIRTYLTRNIFYELDQDCQNGLRTFFKLAAETGTMGIHGKPWSEAAQARSLELHSRISEIREWRETEHNAGRPSGLEDFFCKHWLCFACKATGTRLSLADWDGEIPLFELCSVCGGTGKLPAS